MNELDTATAVTLAELTKLFEAAAMKSTEPDIWSNLLLIVAPFKAALVNVAYSGDADLTVRYLRTAQGHMQGGGLSDLLGATEKFTDLLEEPSYPNRLGDVRMYGMVLRGAAIQAIAEWA